MHEVSDSQEDAIDNIIFCIEIPSRQASTLKNRIRTLSWEIYAFSQEMWEIIKQISGNKIVLKTDLKILILHFLLRRAPD